MLGNTICPILYSSWKYSKSRVFSSSIFYFCIYIISWTEKEYLFVIHQWGQKLFRVFELWLLVIFNYVACYCFLQIYILNWILLQITSGVHSRVIKPPIPPKHSPTSEFFTTCNEKIIYFISKYMIFWSNFLKD